MNRKRDAAGLARASAAAEPPGPARLSAPGLPGERAGLAGPAGDPVFRRDLSRVMTKPDWTVQIGSTWRPAQSESASHEIRGTGPGATVTPGARPRAGCHRQ
jgi:hypothetical protein